MLTELEDGTRGGMGGQEQRGGCTNALLGRENLESKSGAVRGAPCLPLKQQPLPQHGCRLLADSRLSQPWTLNEQAI